jgi:hypothetical protein
MLMEPGLKSELIPHDWNRDWNGTGRDKFALSKSAWRTAMPRFYFDILDDEGTIPDYEGNECPNLGAARQEAEASARDLLTDDIRAHREVDNRRVEVSDACGRVVATFSLKDLLH